jgi:hypothetical protein
LGSANRNSTAGDFLGHFKLAREIIRPDRVA